jgi:endoglycosylceramidase
MATALLAALLAATPAAGSGAGGAPGAPRGTLHNTGRWLTDGHGRVVILHGLNMVYKKPPYQPAAIGFGRDDARFLARNGFNTIRLGLIYKGVEPRPGRYDRGYIRRSLRTERMLHRQGIFSLVDFHQDLYNERFDGEGWPDWAVLDDGVPAEPLSGFPFSYLSSPGLNRAFDNFWANGAGPKGVPIQKRYAAAWARVAKAFAGERGNLGYDLLNEPWPGSAAGSCANTEGCPAFDTGALADFYERTIAAIRGVDRRSTVFYEPHVLFNFGSDTNLPDLGRNLGFSFHDYCLTGLVAGGPSTCEELDEMVFDNADAHAERTGDSLLLSEYGATDDIEVLDRVANYADRHMVSWQEWHYCGCDDPTTQGPGDTQALVKDPAKPPKGDNVFRDKLRALARPYPQAIAGTPKRFRFDPVSRVFKLAYTRKRASGHGSFRRGRTVVFLPRIQYPAGARVRVIGGSARRVDRGRRLLVRPARGARLVRVKVTPPVK